MRKLFFSLLIIVGALFMVSCETPESNEEISQIELYSTEQGDNINTSGSGNEESDNGEE
ncbi:hypothetical protein [Aquimarina spongiae]|uniref:Uncharacterized protein n=1 Tax=Aquimarina spongiae TaxID=570521 RepID=A0A1M6JDL0_9FLAO|nr:hypothetical protein [Aquimarina spongiae]SHJ44819.1 hypothetical protein SAMN04488508_1099 [Aquimarina spongiae]